MSTSYAGGTSTVPLLGQSIDANLRAAVARFGEREALVDVATGRRLTYAQLDAAVDELARGLVGRGVERGDRVGIWAPNCTEWFLTQYATARIGAILVNINPSYRTHEVEFVLRQAGVRLLVSASTSSTRRARPASPRARRSRTTTSSTTATSSARDGLHRAGPHLRAGAVLPLLRHGDGQSRLDQSRRLRRHPGPGLRPAATLRAVQDERCTSLYGVPTMFIAELALPDFAEYDLSSLRTGIMAGSPCPAEVMKRVISEMNMQDVTIAYGMTETSPVSTQTHKPTTRSTGAPPRSGGCTRTSR